MIQVVRAGAFSTALIAVAMGLACSPVAAAGIPLCRLATSEVDGYRGQIELRKGADGLLLGGYLSYRVPETDVALREMAFAPNVPMKLGVLLDFAIDADQSDKALDALEQGGVTDLRIFVGRLTGTSEEVYNKGADILKSYKLDFSVAGQGSASDRYVPVPQSRIGADTYSFGGGDIGIARRIAAPLLAGEDGGGRQGVSIKFVAGAAALEAETKITGYRTAAARLFGGAKALKERDAKGQCKPA